MTDAPVAFTVSAHSDAEGASLRAGDDDLALETRWQPASASTHPGPAELLAGAFAACLLKNIARSGALLPFAYDSASVDVTIHRQDAPPRFTAVEYTVRLVTAEPEHRVELLHRNLQKFGTVYNTVAAVCAVSGTVSVTPPTA
jgi:uncharacterized OsmC-like protein